MEHGKRFLVAVFLGLTAVTAAAASGSTTKATTKGTNRVLLKSVQYFQSLQDQREIREKESTPSLYKRFLEGDADDRVGKDYKKTSLDFKRVRTTKRVPRLKVRKLKQQDETKLQKRSLRYSSVQGDSSKHMDMCAYFKSRGITSPAFCRGKQSRIVRIRSQKSFEDHKGDQVDTMENEYKADTYKGDPNPDAVGEGEQASDHVSEDFQQLDKVEEIFIPARLKEIEESGDKTEEQLPDEVTEATTVTFGEDIESQAETLDDSDMNMSTENTQENVDIVVDAEDMDEAPEDVNEMLNTPEEVLQLTDPSEVSTKPLTEEEDSTGGTLVYQPQFVQAPLYYPPPPLVYNPPVPQCHCHPLCHCHPVPVPHYPTPQAIPYTTSQTTNYPAFPGPVAVKPVYGYTPSTLRSADNTSVKKVVTGALAAGAGLALANHFLNRPQQQGYYGRPQQGYYPPQQQAYYPTQYPHQQPYYPTYQPARPTFGGGYYYGRSIPETKEAKNTPSQTQSNVTGGLAPTAATSTGLFYYFPSYPYHSYYRPTKTRPIRPVRQQTSFSPFLISTLSKENQSRSSHYRNVSKYSLVNG